MLMEECAKGAVRISLNSSIRDVSHADGRFRVEHGDGSAAAPALVIATGGPSIPKMGATGFAYDLARRFGLKIVEPRPALVPLTLGGDEVLFRSLSGRRHRSHRPRRQDDVPRGGALHPQGPFRPRHPANLLLLAPGRADRHRFPAGAGAGLGAGGQTGAPADALPHLLGELPPDRLAEALAKRIGLWGELANIPDRKLEEAERQLADWHFHPNGTEGFAKAEVTAGGISTDELSSQTMEAKKVPGLYAIGEGVDVTGWLGGYNFQWAWASGWAAGQAL
jgi:predicted flavoprotein YhiN